MSGPYRFADAQRAYLFVWNNATHEPVTGDAANITALISKNDSDTYDPVDNTVTELQRGWYYVALSTAEMAAAHTIHLIAETSTADCLAEFKPAVIKPVEMSTDGYPGLDWGNLKNKNTTTSLGNTSIKDVTDLIEVNVTQISGDLTAANNLETAFKGLQDQTVNTVSFTPIHSGSTTIFESLSNYFDDDALIGQVISWADGTNVGLSATVLDFLGTTTLGGTRNRYTVSKLPSLPTSGDTFFITSANGALASIGGSNLSADSGANFQLFFDNAASATTKVVDDVGGLSAAEINTEVDNALVDIGLDHLVFTSVTGGDIADNSIIASLVSKGATADWDTFVNTTDSLEALRDNQGAGGGGISWEDDYRDHRITGTMGKRLQAW